MRGAIVEIFKVAIYWYCEWEISMKLEKKLLLVLQKNSFNCF